VYAIDIATGQGKWTRATNGRVLASPVVARGIVYVSSHDHLLYALDAATGTVKWSVDVTSGKLATPSVK
jgi:outer membrane protein assembly factor BamB